MIRMISTVYSNHCIYFLYIFIFCIKQILSFMRITAAAVAALVLVMVLLIVLTVLLVLWMTRRARPSRPPPGPFEIIPQVLTTVDCRILIDLAETSGFRPYIAQSGWGDRALPWQESAFLDPTDSATVRDLYRRIATYTGYSIDRFDARMEIIRQLPGSGLFADRTVCDPRYDENCRSQEYRGSRLLTLLIPLNNQFLGGEIYFPQSGTSVDVSQGDALIFRNALPNPDGTCTQNRQTDYAIRPVTSGRRYLGRIVVRGECSSLRPYNAYTWSY